MKIQSSKLEIAVNALAGAIQLLNPSRENPVLVAIDGGSGSGKSTLAGKVARKFQSALVKGDDFFAANITEVGWDARCPAERAVDCIDWRRLRVEALEPLLRGEAAKWHAFDFEAGLCPDGTYGMRTDYVHCAPAAVIILEGSYAARPEFSDLIDLSVLVDVPVEIRHARLRVREEVDFLADWHARWDEAERYYFTHIRPAASFDFVVT